MTKAVISFDRAEDAVQLTDDQVLGRAGFRGCGIETTQCCAYLVLGTDGFECQQRGALRKHLMTKALNGQMNARRLPQSDFPACQEEGR